MYARGWRCPDPAVKSGQDGDDPAPPHPRPARPYRLGRRTSSPASPESSSQEAAFAHLRTLVGSSHIMQMAQPPSKEERMELRRKTGNRAPPLITHAPYHRGPLCLWPHACFDCHKSWKLPDDASGKCPECGETLHSMGRAFKVPKKSDSEQWAKVRALWFAGFRFLNHTRRQEAEPFPERLREVDDFVRRNTQHPFRVAKRNGS